MTKQTKDKTKTRAFFTTSPKVIEDTAHHLLAAQRGAEAIVIDAEASGESVLRYVANDLKNILGEVFSIVTARRTKPAGEAVYYKLLDRVRMADYAVNSISCDEEQSQRALQGLALRDVRFALAWTREIFINK